MQTATAQINNPNTGMGLEARILFDSGSQRSYITVHLADLLKLKKYALENLLVYTFGSNKPKQIKSCMVDIDVNSRNWSTIRVSCSIIPQIPGEFPRITLNFPDVVRLLKRYPLADTAT